MALSRADNSILGRWWWTVDRWTLAALMVLIGFGYVLMLAASPAVAPTAGVPIRRVSVMAKARRSTATVYHRDLGR